MNTLLQKTIHHSVDSVADGLFAYIKTLKRDRLIML